MKILILRVKAETEWIPIKTITLFISALSGRLNSMNSKISSVSQIKSYNRKKKEKGKGNHFSSQIIPQIRV